MIGADPEFGLMTMAEGKATGLAPATLFLPPKDKAIQVEIPSIVREKGAINYVGARIDNDGWHAEMQRTASHCIALGLDSEWLGLRTAHDICRKNGLSLFLGDHAPINREWLEKAGPDAMVNGCNPSLDSRSGRLAEPIHDFIDMLVEEGCYLGGHVHLEIEPEFIQKMDLNAFVRFMIPFAVLPMAIATFTESQKMRYRRVGVGIYRKPSYGIELKDFGGATMTSPIYRAATYGLARCGLRLFIRYAATQTAAPMEKAFIDALLNNAPPDECADALVMGDLDHMWHIFSRVKDLMLTNYTCDGSYPFHHGYGVTVMSTHPKRSTISSRFLKMMSLKPENRQDPITAWALDKDYEYHIRGLDSGTAKLEKDGLI